MRLNHGSCRICGRWMALNDANLVWRHDPAKRLSKLVSCSGSWRPAEKTFPQQLEIPAQRLGRQVWEAEREGLFSAEEVAN
jgi:hypothetical protein